MTAKNLWPFVQLTFPRGQNQFFFFWIRDREEERVKYGVVSLWANGNLCGPHCDEWNSENYSNSVPSFSVEHSARSHSACRKGKQHPSRWFFSDSEVHHTGLGRPLVWRISKEMFVPGVSQVHAENWMCYQEPTAVNLVLKAGEFKPRMVVVAQT